MKNRVMLITYADSLGNNIKELTEVLDKHFKEEIGSVHLLPFYPSSGDRGFAPLTYEKVDSKFGDWQDVKKLSEKYDIMADFMINHISKQSIYFKDYIKYNKKSKYRDLFIDYDAFWNREGVNRDDVDLIYKRKPKDPYEEITFKDGTCGKVWVTFGEEQIDLDITTDVTKKFIKDNLELLIDNGVNVIRLDAFAYATKKAGTDCFFIEPEVWELLDECNEIVENKGGMLLPEIHEHYSIHKKLEQKDYYTYDFALPMLTLYSLYSKDYTPLLSWLDICPRKQYTTLDTHDGIGVVDVVDLLSDEQIEYTKSKLYEQGANVKRKYNSVEYKNLDIYQINCTYYSALGDDDTLYFLSRLIQFFTPGIPQVYYVGMLSGKNDVDLMEKTKFGRNINRHYYTTDEIDDEMNRDINIKLKKLMHIRNNINVFDGEYSTKKVNENTFVMRFDQDGNYAQAMINLDNYTYEIEYKYNSCEFKGQI